MIVQALATLDGDFDRATPFLLGTAAVASLGPYGQASAVQVVGPPKGPFGTITSYHESHDYELTMNHIVTMTSSSDSCLSLLSEGVTAFKTTRGADRYTALAGGSWAEVILCTLFGWRPSLNTASAELLWRAATPRGERNSF
jgi:hypothetical protein